jgi:hypothetical protein
MLLAIPFATSRSHVLGFPRSLKNAKDFVEQFGMGECCLHFDCPREAMISRIIERGKVRAMMNRYLFNDSTNALEICSH